LINYPNAKKPLNKENNYSNKGMTLERDIEFTNEFYLNSKIACIHKKPTPIQIVDVSFPARNKAKIVEAYYRTPSTTDFNGVYKGLYIDFDAKECSAKTAFPLKNIKPHQLEHLKNVKNCGGVAFFIVYFSFYNEYYYLPFEIVEKEIAKKERNSISYDTFKENCFLIKFGFNPRLDYLKIIDKIYFEKH
jgi:recombination protein U